MITGRDEVLKPFFNRPLPTVKYFLARGVCPRRELKKHVKLKKVKITHSKVLELLLILNKAPDWEKERQIKNIRKDECISGMRNTSAMKWDTRQGKGGQRRKKWKIS